jgi:hypothetical protein
VSNLALPLAFLFRQFWIFYGWQIIPFVLLIVIIVAYMMYRRRQV